MIVQANQELPNSKELIQELKKEFSDLYSFKIFNIGSQDSILVRKSNWVGVQITIRGKEIRIDGSFPNIIISSLMTLLTQSTLAPIDKWVKLEKKIASFFNRRYV